MTERYGTRVVRAREAIEPILLRGREAALLGQAAGRPALLVEGIAFSADGVPIEFARSYVRGDRTRYYVERVVVRAQPPGDDPVTAPVGERRSVGGAVPDAVG